MHKYTPCKGRRIPSGWNGITDFVGDNKRVSINMNIEEYDEVAIKSQVLDVCCILCPRTAVESKHSVEQP